MRFLLLIGTFLYSLQSLLGAPVGAQPPGQLPSSPLTNPIKSTSTAPAAVGKAVPASTLPAKAGNVVDLGELSRQGEGAPVYPIAIISPLPEVAQTANAAFSLHGGFKIVQPSAAAFTLRLNRAGADKVELTIESGNPAQVQFRQEVVADSPQRAILKACDLAVQKILGIPGFFAGKIAFVSGQQAKWEEIFTADILFQKIRQLTQDKHHSVTPHWSPDGRYLTYTGYYLSEFPDLFMIDTQTGRRRPLARYQGMNTGGVFSPNGAQMAMILSSSGNPEVYVADAQGRKPKRLTKSKALEASPSWSPDGQKLVFTSDRAGGPQIFEMNIATQATRRLPLNISKYCAEPAWNPLDANLIACTAAVSKSFQVAIFDFKTEKARFITQGPAEYVEACWLNDGRHIICTRRQDKAERLVILDTQTGKQVPLHGEGLGNASQAAFVYY